MSEWRFFLSLGAEVLVFVVGLMAMARGEFALASAMFVLAAYNRLIRHT